MKKKVIIMLLLISLHRNLLAEEPELNTIPKKSVIAGILLGALGFTGVPGTYGWGNFYAKDNIGFWVLNIGGSACTVLKYASAFTLFTGSGPYSEEWELLFYAGLIGSYGFALASTIWGALSVISYNGRVVTENNRLGYQLASGAKGLSMEITYRY